jgi:hypothetical protein
MCSSWGSKLYTNSYFEEIEHVFHNFWLCEHFVRKKGIYFKQTVGNGSLHEINNDLEFRVKFCNSVFFFLIHSHIAAFINMRFSDGRVDLWFYRWVDCDIVLYKFSQHLLSFVPCSVSACSAQASPCRQRESRTYNAGASTLWIHCINCIHWNHTIIKLVNWNEICSLRGVFSTHVQSYWFLYMLFSLFMTYLRHDIQVIDTWTPCFHQQNLLTLFWRQFGPPSFFLDLLFCSFLTFFALMHVASILHFIILANYTKRINSI